MISIEENGIGDSKWNERLIRSGLGTIYQTKEFSSHYKRSQSNTVFLKFVDEKGGIVGQLLLAEYSRFKDRGTKGKILKKIPGLKKKLCKWVYGPVIFDKNLSADIYSSLEKFLLSRNYVVTGSQHPMLTNGVSAMKQNFKLKKWGTFIIDLSKPKEDLYKNIDKHSGRKNIERALKRGVKIEEINEKNLNDFTELYQRYKNKRVPKKEDFDEMRIWWDTLKPIGYGGFLAKLEEEPIGGIMFSCFNGYIIEGGVSRSEDDTRKKLYSQDLIKWRIIEWGIKNRMRYYDLAGFNPYSKSKKEEGIFKYKKKWGGKNYYYWKILK